jgi:hypothetical protein
MIYVQGIVMPKVYYYLNSILFECKISITYLFLFTQIIVRIYKIKTYYLSNFDLRIYRYKLFKLNAKGEKVYYYLNSILFECKINITYLFLFTQIIVRIYKIKTCDRHHGPRVNMIDSILLSGKHSLSLGSSQGRN